jgi:flagellar hook protein FlgE
MSVSGMMGTSASGMAAQSDRLSSTADNIANIGTTGYKRSAVEFSTMVTAVNPGRIESGAVESRARRATAEQGVLQATRSPTDLAIEGQGFFVVEGPGGERALTRAGAFTRDRDGMLTNAAGYRLLAAPLRGSNAEATLASVSSLIPVAFEETRLRAAATTGGSLHVTLPSEDDAVLPGELPSANAGSAKFSAMTSMNAFDGVGAERQLDIYFAKSGTNSWEVTVFDHSLRGTPQAFPYSGGPLTTTFLQFDPATGGIQSPSNAALSLTVPGGGPITIGLSETSQLATTFSVRAASLDGHAPVPVERVEVSSTGVVTAVYADGTQVPSFRIPLGRVPSPEQLTTLGNNLFAPSDASGQLIVDFASQSGTGRIASGALELSTVDLASELTVMIEAQRNYTANSRVFQTASDLMDVIVNLRR